MSWSLIWNYGIEVYAELSVRCVADKMPVMKLPMFKLYFYVMNSALGFIKIYRVRFFSNIDLDMKT